MDGTLRAAALSGRDSLSPICDSRRHSRPALRSQLGKPNNAMQRTRDKSGGLVRVWLRAADRQRSATGSPEPEQCACHAGVIAERSGPIAVTQAVPVAVE